ncbi:exonuclease domain-containing protein [Streptomyces sp. PA03-6a]|nr:exonuclease domain-containing protein [Streptomyces sp. PA03-6a]
MNATFLTAWRAAWDTETTGTSVFEDRIVTAAFIVRAPGRDDRVFSWLINTGVPIPAEAAEVHGIDDAKAQADGVEPRAALDELAGHITTAVAHGMPLVAFNHSFDWSILHYELLRHGLPTIGERLGKDPVTLVDPIVIDKQMDRYVKGTGARKLKPTCERYGVELTDWHTAEADALAALLIAEAQFAKYPRLNTLSPGALFASQAKWRAEQQASLQKWFRTKATPEQGGDPNKVIAGEWPLLPAEEVQA